ncbi:MAG: GTPase Era [Gammaproteobacteria bacterium BRH_c0]|nr:MAG: GTPase Era [Gammaproteobacteria bacterium BRH_c0]
MTDTKNYCGYVAIVGRPNVGKSTLLNHLLGFKLSITSRKPQTTRHNVLGILTEDDCQIIFVDTPGLHSGQTKALNRYMNRAAGQAIADVDVVVFVVDQDKWTEADAAVVERLAQVDVPVIVAVNKVDRVDEKDALLPQLKLIAELLPKADIVPVSALYGKNLDVLRTTIRGYIPEGFYFFPDDQITDKSERFLAAEIVREKITRQLGAEVPYEVTVEIEEWRREEKILHISALILVERDGQKKIIIGEKGARLKKIGQQARVDMEKLFDSKIMLKLWVKVRAGWSDDERALKSLGYHDN